MLAEVGQVYRLPGLAVLLGLDHHPGAPIVVLALGHPLKDTLLDIGLDVSFDLVSVVQGHHRRLLTAFGLCVGLCVDPHRLACYNWP